MSKVHVAVTIAPESRAKIRAYVQNRIFGGLKRFTFHEALTYLLNAEIDHVLVTLGEEEEEVEMLEAAD